MTFTFARRIEHAPASFLGELFRVSADPSIISFARRAPVVRADRHRRDRCCCTRCVYHRPGTALQYSTTDGYRPLREYIAERYRTAARHPRDCRRDPDRERVAAVPRSLREDLHKPRRPGGHGAAGIPRGDRGVLALRAGLLKPCRSIMTGRTPWLLQR